MLLIDNKAIIKIIFQRIKKMEYSKAILIAQEIKRRIANTPGIRKVEIVGSIRREKPEVKDIEILIEPDVIEPRDLFGNKLLDIPQSERIDWIKLLEADFGPVKKIKGGMRYKQYSINPPDGQINLDLFICFPPAQWGALKVIRTGPWEFSKKVVTPEYKGGYLKNQFIVVDGSVVMVGSGAYATPTEKDFFDCLIIDYLKPKDRK